MTIFVSDYPSTESHTLLHVEIVFIKTKKNLTLRKVIQTRQDLEVATLRNRLVIK